MFRNEYNIETHKCRSNAVLKVWAFISKNWNNVCIFFAFFKPLFFKIKQGGVGFTSRLYFIWLRIQAGFPIVKLIRGSPTVIEPRHLAAPPRHHKVLLLVRGRGCTHPFPNLRKCLCVWERERGRERDNSEGEVRAGPGKTFQI
jgi:hypothetical protein